jgi:hypothetical protein
MENDLIFQHFEGNPHGESTTIQDARAFVTRVQDVTGRWPGIYGGFYLKQLIGSLPDKTLKNCWFWCRSTAPRHTCQAIGITGRCGNPWMEPWVSTLRPWRWPCDRNCYCNTPEQPQRRRANGTL